MIYIKNTTGRDYYDHNSEFTFVQNELLTEREFNVFCPSFSPKLFTKVKVKKRNTYKFFGIRFENDNSAD